MQNRNIVLAEIPQDRLARHHFRLEEAQMPVPGAGEVLLRTLYMSIDAANRAWMQGPSYREAVRAGETMPTYAIAEVIESRSDRVAQGAIVATEGLWSDHIVRPASAVQVLPRTDPLSHLVSVMGIAGKTAFHGLVGVGRPMAGETVLVSAAAGSVGSLVGQIARALGCRAVGIAGGPEKCAWVVETLGFDACLDYRNPELLRALRAACPDGVDVYFDNVGGDVLGTALTVMNERGRVVCCGAISQYDTAEAQDPARVPGLIVVKRLRMEGFIVMDHAREDARALRALGQWVREGRITVVEDIVEGLENAPAALIGLLNGDNRGKRMVHVADPQGEAPA